MNLSGSGFPVAGMSCVWILEEVFDAAFVDKQVWLGVPRDADDVLVVVLDPASNLFAIGEFHNYRSLVL